MLLHDILDRQARRSPDRVAVRRGAVAWSYEVLRRRSVGYRDWLRDRDVGRGDRVLVAAPHAPETVAMLYAAARLGALYVIVGDAIPPNRLRQILDDCEPRVVVAQGTSATVAHEAGVPSVVALADLPADGPDEASVPDRTALSIDPVSLIYTSGSTAAPKAVVSTHAQVLFAAQAIQSRLRYRSDDVVFCCLPLSFDYGLYQVFLAGLAGAELVLGDPGDAGPALLLRLLDSGASVLPAVPSLVTTLLLLLKRRSQAPPRLRLLTSSGAALARQVPHQLRELVPGLDVVLMFGLTECKRVAIMPANGDIDRPGAAGRALPDTELRVVDPDGRPLPPGEIGELVVRGPHVMSGYWRAPDLTAQRFRRDEFGQPLLYTGDQCRLDPDGYLYFVGRLDDIYKQRGYRVSAVEVESAARDVPGVVEAAVLVPTGDRGAVLVVTGAVTGLQVLKELAHRLEGFKLPDLCLVAEALPLGANGKLDKRALGSFVGDRARVAARRRVPAGAP